MNADRRASSTSSLSDFSYYTAIRKFITKENIELRKKDSSTQLAMDAMATTEVPEEEQQMTDPEIPIVTKLEQFEQRMERIASTMPPDVFTIFTLASKLKLDDTVSKAFQ